MVRVPGSFNSNLAELNEKGEIINIPDSAEVITTLKTATAEGRNNVKTGTPLVMT